MNRLDVEKCHVDRQGLSEPSTRGALVVDEDPAARQSLRLCLETSFERVLGVATPAGALEAVARADFDLVLLDLWLGSSCTLALLPELTRRGAAVIVTSAQPSYESAVEAIKLGAADYLPKPFSADQVRAAIRRASTERERDDERPSVEPADAEIVMSSRSACFQSFLSAAERAAAADCVILLRGESGTGKNVFARWLHDHSPRRDGPFVVVHCPALAGELMASTLFGHRRGAFTGAVADVTGKVHEANGGTLFLDEVGDLSLDAQARLLRFLHDQTYERVGDAREERADVRIVAATNRDLEAQVRAGTFREDLLYRLDVITLALPPLRDRREDILPLADHFLRAATARHQRYGIAFARESPAALAAHAWPGNVRELRHAVERAVILAPTPAIAPRDLGIPAATSAVAPTLGSDVTLDDIEREHIAQVLARAPSLEAAARSLGIDTTTLQRKRRRYGLA
jgi:NtrC-family two-component system response regulator AlgB